MSHDEHNPGEPEFGEHAGEAPHNPGEPEFGAGGSAGEGGTAGEPEFGDSAGEEKPRQATDPSTFSPERAPDDAGA